jgi:hypothetical protein
MTIKNDYLGVAVIGAGRIGTLRVRARHDCRCADQTPGYWGGLDASQSGAMLCAMSS